MTAWNGYSVPSGEVTQRFTSGSSLAGNTYVRPAYPAGVYGFGNVSPIAPMVEAEGPASGGSPSPPSTTYDGYLVPSYSEDIFDHFLLTPSELALGNLLNTEVVVMTLGNLYGTSKVLASITNPISGVTVTGVSLPITIPPYGSVSFDVSISNVGSPTVSGALSLVGENPDTTDPETLTLMVTGTRLTLFPYDPEQFYKEELQWKTDIIESYSGIEQRIKLRQNPRQKLTYEVFATDPNVNISIRMLFFGWLPRIFGVPIWWEQSPLLIAAPSGVNVLNINTANADYRINGLVFIRTPSKLIWEAAEITGITSSTLTIQSDLSNNYPINSQVMPARTAYAKTQTSHDTLITGVSKMTVEFTTLDNTDLAYWDTSLWPNYLGFPVLGDINYVESSLREGNTQNKVTVIDNLTGTLYQVASTDRSRPSSVKTWWTNYASDIWPIRQMSHYLGGSQGTFWLPTNRNDLQLAANINPGDTALTVNYVGYTAFALDVNGDPMVPFGHIRITLTNSTQIYCILTGAAAGSSTETLDVSVAITGTLITIAEVQRIEFVQLMRLIDDKVTLTHDHPGRAQIVMNCVGVRA